jgi:EmrB/QacA subfamily drug resistance transporter
MGTDDRHAGTSTLEDGRTPWVVLTVAAFGMCVLSLDTTVNVALPEMTAALGAPIAQLQWIIIAYVLTNTSLVLGCGRLADLLGRRRIWTAGLFALSAALLCCGLAQNAGQLVAARAGQAVGAAMVASSGAALVTSAFPERERGRALGLLSMGASIGMAGGPLLGGALVTLFGWQSVFLARAPIALMAGLMSLILLPRIATAPRREPFDALGAVLLAGGMAAFVLALNRGPIWGWSDLRVLACLSGATLLLCGFVLRERVCRSPILNLGLFRDRRLAAANASGYLSSLAMFGVWLLLPYYLVDGRGYSAIRSGWFLACVPVAIAVTAPFSGRLSDRRGAWLPTTLGLTLEICALLLVAGFDEDTSVLVIVLSLLTMGTALGLFQAPNQSTVMSSVPPASYGVAGGMLFTFNGLGIVSGVAVLGAVYDAARPDAVTGDATAFSAEAFAAAFSFAAGVALAALLVSIARGGRMPDTGTTAAPMPPARGAIGDG